MGNGNDEASELAKEAKRRKEALERLNKKIVQGRKLTRDGDLGGLLHLSHEMLRDKSALMRNLPGVLGVAFQLWYEELDLLDHSIELLGRESAKSQPNRDVVKELLEEMERRKKKIEGYLHLP